MKIADLQCARRTFFSTHKPAILFFVLGIFIGTHLSTQHGTAFAQNAMIDKDKLFIEQAHSFLALRGSCDLLVLGDADFGRSCRPYLMLSPTVGNRKAVLVSFGEDGLPPNDYGMLGFIGAAAGNRSDAFTDFTVDHVAVMQVQTTLLDHIPASGSCAFSDRSKQETLVTCSAKTQDGRRYLSEFLLSTKSP